MRAEILRLRDTSATMREYVSALSAWRLSIDRQLKELGEFMEETERQEIRLEAIRDYRQKETRFRLTGAQRLGALVGFGILLADFVRSFH